MQAIREPVQNFGEKRPLVEVHDNKTQTIGCAVSVIEEK